MYFVITRTCPPLKKWLGLPRTSRRELKLKPPDAVHLATAILSGAQRLYTYDEDDLLPLEQVEGVQIMKPKPLDPQLRILPDLSHARPPGKAPQIRLDHVIDLGRDPATGKRKRLVRGFKGTKREAEQELARLPVEYEKGTQVQPSRMTSRSTYAGGSRTIAL